MKNSKTVGTTQLDDINLAASKMRIGQHMFRLHLQTLKKFINPRSHGVGRSLKPEQRAQIVEACLEMMTRDLQRMWREAGEIRRQAQDFITEAKGEDQDRESSHG